MVAPVPSSRRILARIRFALLATISVTIGFLPLVMARAQRVGFYLLVIAGVSLLISLAFAVGLDPKNERPVSLMERAAIAIAALSEGSIIGLVLFLFYGFGWTVTGLLDKIGWHPHWIDTIGTYVFLGFGFLFLVGVTGITTERLTKWLFPTTGIGNARLLPYTKPRQFSWPKLVVAIFAFAFLAFCFIRIRPIFYLLLQFALVAVGTPVTQQLEKDGPSEHERILRTAVTNLLQVCGYTIVDRLQTQDLELDRLISVFDMFAHSEGFGLAIQLKSDEESKDPVSWTEATYLGSATHAIYSATENLEAPIYSVIPLMILSGRKADSKLESFAERESIRIVEMPEWSKVQDIADQKLSNAELIEIAQTYLGMRAPASSNQTAEQIPSEAHI